MSGQVPQVLTLSYDRIEVLSASAALVLQNPGKSSESVVISWVHARRRARDAVT